MVLAFSFRMPNWGISLVAGLAAALAFVTQGNFGMLTAILGNFCPLPLMIASFGWSGSTGIAASIIAGLTIFALNEGHGALEFIGLIGLPCVGLAVLAQRRINQDLYYPIGRALAWIGWAAIFTSLADIAIWASRSGGYEAATADLARQYLPVVQEVIVPGFNLPAGVSAEALAQIFARVVPYASVVTTTFFLVINLWLAARITRLAGRLERPWPSLPEQTALPRHEVLVLSVSFAVLGSGLALGSSSLVLVSGVFIAGVAALYALQGLAVVHAVTRKIPFRGAILALVYLGIVFLSLWPVILAALVGLADSLVSLRREPPANEDL